MFDVNDILARLQNGEDMQKIADEMAATLNLANKTYADQKAKEAEAKRAAEEAAKRAEIQKREELQSILDLFSEWLNTYYNVPKEVTVEVDVDTVLELITSIQEYAEALKGLENLFSMKPVVKKPIGTKIIKSNTKPVNADETINAFLKNMGW